MPEANHIVALDVLAKRLGISQRWLRQEAVAGRIPYLQAGARRVFNVEAVAQALAERAADPNPENLSDAVRGGDQ